MNHIATKFQEALRRSLPTIQVEPVSARSINLKPKTNGIYLGIRAANRIELDDAQAFMKLIGATFTTVIDRQDYRLSIYFVAVKKEGDR